MMKAGSVWDTRMDTSQLACCRFGSLRPSFYGEIGNCLNLSGPWKGKRFPSSKSELNRRYGINARAIATEPRPEVESSNIVTPRPRMKQSMRVGDMSEEFKKMRAQMEEDEQLASLMRGLRGQNLSDSLFAADDVQLRLVENEVSRAIELREIVTSLGPAYIKLGQALSIRPDILSPAAMTELQKLCDKVPSFPDDVAMALIEEELGQPWPEMYSDLSPSPIAAASLGQVYKGHLRENGDLVAVKVQRPFVLETVTIDLYIIRKLGMALRKFPQISIDVVGLVDEWAARFFEELDYINEGENGTRFAEMMRKDLPQIVKAIDAISRQQLAQLATILGIERLVPVFGMVPVFGSLRPAALLPTVTEEDKIVLNNASSDFALITTHVI